MYIQEFYSNIHGINTVVPRFATMFRATSIVVTPDLIFKVLHIPRVTHPNYPGCQCLRIMSKDELLSLFYKRPSIWGGR